MKRDLGKEKLKATEAAPMQITGLKDARVRNQTTQVPKTRFPWTTLIMIVVLVLFLTAIIILLDVGAS